MRNSAATHEMTESAGPNFPHGLFNLCTKGKVNYPAYAWIVKNRRFVRDYEQLPGIAEIFVLIPTTAALIGRWT